MAFSAALAPSPYGRPELLLALLAFLLVLLASLGCIATQEQGPYLGFATQKFGSFAA